MTILQSDDQWILKRCGFLTASVMSTAREYTKREPIRPTAAHMKLRYEIATSRLTGKPAEHFVSYAMQRGQDLEPHARDEIEAETGWTLGPATFEAHPTIAWFGATPDGAMMGEHGLVEIKCPLPHNFAAWKHEGIIPEQHIDQMLAQLAVTRRKWVQFIAYCPDFPEGSRLFMPPRFEPTADQIAACEADAVKFLKEVEAVYQSL